MLSNNNVMVQSRFPPIIEPIFDFQTPNSNNELYSTIIQNALQRVFPEYFFSLTSDENLKKELAADLPLVRTITSCVDTFPSHISFFALSKQRVNSFKFFFNIINSWLIPGKKLNICLSYAADFRMPEFENEVYTFYEIVVQIDNQEELDLIQRNLPIVETELRLGIQSSHYARRILELKSLTADQKTTSIQEYVVDLINRFSHEFDHDVLTEMQHVLVICGEEFKASRSSRHLSRIIGIHYLFRKNLKEAVKAASHKRHLSLKLIKTQLQLPAGKKRVLGLLVGVNFLRDKEIFEEKHLLKAIQNYIPSARAVKNSFFANKRTAEHVCTLYLEIEKEDGKEFTFQEIRTLRQELPSDLKDRIEHLMHPVFMPRNEEETIRSILSLSNQIKYLRDIPQVSISFDEQSHISLFFTVILVRILRSGDPSIQELFRNSNSFLEYIHDRNQNAGNLRRKYKKEATVFRVKLNKEPFLRLDHSIDLNKARQAVVSELCRVVGEVRDYNGGMISKQNELICEVRHLLASTDMKYNDLLLENFFYSLTPVIMRTVLEPQALRSLFFMLLKAIEEKLKANDSYSISVRKEPHFTYAMIKTEDRSLKDQLNRALVKLQLHSSELASSYVLVYDVAYLGYIYRCDEPSKQQQFCQILQSVLSQWNQKKIASKVSPIS